MKIYRNIYFLKSIVTSGNGSLNILYYGLLYSNAKHIKDFDKLYDKNLDLVISCTKCFMNKLGKITKVARQ